MIKRINSLAGYIFILSSFFFCSYYIFWQLYNYGFYSFSSVTGTVSLAFATIGLLHINYNQWHDKLLFEVQVERLKSRMSYIKIIAATRIGDIIDSDKINEIKIVSRDSNLSSALDVYEKMVSKKITSLECGGVLIMYYDLCLELKYSTYLTPDDIKEVEIIRLELKKTNTQDIKSDVAIRLSFNIISYYICARLADCEC